MSFHILLGSTSIIKKDAVEMGFGEALANLQCFSSQSGVPSQPIGRAQTRLGAFNRAVHAISLAKGPITTTTSTDNTSSPAAFHYAIGIENGMWNQREEDAATGSDAMTIERERGDQQLQSAAHWQESADWVDGACVCALRVEDGVASLAPPCVDDDEYKAVFLFSEELLIPPKSKRPFACGPDGEWSVLKVRGGDWGILGILGCGLWPFGYS